jgi:hypothetical protein
MISNADIKFPSSFSVNHRHPRHPLLSVQVVEPLLKCIFLLTRQISRKYIVSIREQIFELSEILEVKRSM